ncbi:hypothetical protein Hbl1158_04145 [Halobaculum sp. CBA1158]|uniref:hypothetical protein n=1 Tax=Halobaculum sp. CBA1158 TaxID=2904243 RepID=UPI001F1652D9|nr:hypothetical protein [Halobaculum sp. CBA1158]UIP00561.1 hypothetical protein Hbl1158_04145 [Halobaculum sp. CBA1158]
MPLDRRSFLATTATLAVTATGGCTGCAPAPTASLRLTAEDDAGLAREALYAFGADDDPANPDALAREVVETGSATVEDTREPLPTDRPVVVAGEGVYRFAAETVDSREVHRFGVTMNPIRTADGEETPDSADRIRFADLPGVDREALSRAGYDDHRPPGVGTTLSYRPGSVEESVLVPDPEYDAVVWPDGPGTIEVDDRGTDAVYTYRLTADRVASAAEFGADVRERFGFALEGLPAEEREIVEAAVDPETPAPDGDDYSGYHVASDEEPSDALRSLVDRFRDRDPVAFGWEDPPGGDRVGGEYVVRYDGAVYWASLRVDESAFTGGATGTGTPT